MEVRTTCPLGHTCERAVEGAIERCAWYTRVVGVDPQTGQDVDDWRCAIAWQPVIMLEVAAKVNTGNATMQSLRNNLDERQKQALEVVKKNVPVLSNS